MLGVDRLTKAEHHRAFDPLPSRVPTCTVTGIHHHLIIGINKLLRVRDYLIIAVPVKAPQVTCFGAQRLGVSLLLKAYVERCLCHHTV